MNIVSRTAYTFVLHAYPIREMKFLYLESPDSVTCTRGDATAARVCETLRM